MEIRNAAATRTDVIAMLRGISPDSVNDQTKSRTAGGAGTDWLLDPGWAFFWTIFVSIWAHMGFYTLILLAGLQAIPGDLYEAASMDAASPQTAMQVNRMRRIRSSVW